MDKWEERPLQHLHPWLVAGLSGYDRIHRGVAILNQVMVDPDAITEQHVIQVRLPRQRDGVLIGGAVHRCIGTVEEEHHLSTTHNELIDLVLVRFAERFRRIVNDNHLIPVKNRTAREVYLPYIV